MSAEKSDVKTSALVTLLSAGKPNHKKKQNTMRNMGLDNKYRVTYYFSDEIKLIPSPETTEKKCKPWPLG